MKPKPPELDLVAAVMWQAVDDIQSAMRSRELNVDMRRTYDIAMLLAEAETALEWLTHHGSEPWSCGWCCAMLGVDQAAVRRWIERERVADKIAQLRARYTDMMALRRRRRRQKKSVSY